MSDSEFPELEERLRTYGGNAVDPAVQSQHLTAIAHAAPVRRRSSLAHKVRVAGALIGGFFLGSTGLAFAGALPDTAQDAAQEALSRVGITVQGGTERYQGAECGTPDGGGEWRNHGHYVRSQPEAEREAAGESDCGKPLVSVGKSDNETDNETDNEGAGEPNECAADGQAIAEDNKARRGKPDNPGKPDHAGKPDQAGKPECAPEGGNEAQENSDANDAVTDSQPSSTPAEPEEKPVETPEEPPATAGDDAGTQGVTDTPSDDEGEVPEETPPSEADAGNVPEETPPADEEAEEAPPED